MKLLYLYIRDYGILKDIEFNFDSEYRFHFDKDTRELTGGETESALPKNFFSINKKGNDRVVESISAIVGNNGAGKTSIANFLDELGKHDGIIIYMKGNELYLCIISHGKGTMVIYDMAAFNRIDLGELKKDFKIIYCSNAFSTQNVCLRQDDNFIDLSTSNLLRDGYFRDKDHEQTVDAYCRTELNDNIRFFAECDKHKKTMFNLPIPTGIDISINDTRVKKYIEGCQKYIATNSAQKDQPTFRQCKNIKEINRIVSASQNAFALIYFSFLIDILNFQGDLNQDYWVESTKYLLNQLKKESIDNSLAFKHFFKKLLKAFKGWIDKNSTGDKLGKKHELSDLGSRIAQVYKLVRLIEKNNWTFTFFPYCSCEINLLKEGEKEKIIKIINCYYDGNFINRYLDFSWIPRLAAGEYAQLSLYARLFRIQKTPLEKGGKIITPVDKDGNGDRDIIIFFDEIEITVHPELQRKLVFYLIEFFEEFYQGFKVHLIFATHSPVLLSDIPKSNVCFLKRETDENNNPIVKNVTKKRKDNTDKEENNTFGANIHSLYRHSFFMNEGSMGAFATKKINEIIKELNPDDEKQKKEKFYGEKYNELEERINLIGEPVIRDNLMNLLISRHSDPRQAKYDRLKKELDKLEKSIKERK